MYTIRTRTHTYTYKHKQNCVYTKWNGKNIHQVETVEQEKKNKVFVFKITASN